MRRGLALGCTDVDIVLAKLRRIQIDYCPRRNAAAVCQRIFSAELAVVAVVLAVEKGSAGSHQSPLQHLGQISRPKCFPWKAASSITAHYANPAREPA